MELLQSCTKTSISSYQNQVIGPEIQIQSSQTCAATVLSGRDYGNYNMAINLIQSFYDWPNVRGQL